MKHLTRVRDGREQKVEHQLGLSMWEYFPVIHWTGSVLFRPGWKSVAAHIMQEGREPAFTEHTPGANPLYFMCCFS